jgi:hypothetical protein
MDTEMLLGFPGPTVVPIGLYGWSGEGLSDGCEGNPDVGPGLVGEVPPVGPDGLVGEDPHDGLPAPGPTFVPLPPIESVGPCD